MRTKDTQKVLALQQAAFDLVATGGISSLSMAKLARAAEVSVATTYVYFENKADLLGSLYEEALQYLLAAQDQIDLTQHSLDDAFKIILENYAKRLIENPRYANFVSAMNANPEFLPVELRGQGSLISGDFLWMIGQAQQAGRLRTKNLDLIVAQVIQPMFWLITERQRNNLTIDAEEIKTFVAMGQRAIFI